MSLPGRLICDPLFERHRTGPAHPEGPDRIQVIRRGLEGFEAPPWRWVDPADPIAEADLTAVHPPSYVDSVRAAAREQRALDADTPTSEASFRVARVAAGSAVHLARASRRDGGPGFGAVRPPGHHAEPDRGMGFCLFNNVALAAEAIRRQGGRVAIVDIDVHHGNGTQRAFYGTDEVLYVSLHQFPFYPGTGRREETGRGRGEGYTLNVPLPAGSGWDRMEDSWEGDVREALEAFGPDHLMVSAGFDGHRQDPIGGWTLTDEDYLRMAEDLRTWSRAFGGADLLGMLEGGYSRPVLERLVPRFVSRLFGGFDPG